MECNYSRIKSVGMFFLGLLMVSVSYFCTTIPKIDAKMVGWLGVCFFGLCFLKIILNLFKQGQAFIINEQGMQDFRSKWGFILWSDIVYVSIGVVRSTRFLCIEVKDQNIYLSRIPPWQRFLKDTNKNFGFPMINVSFSTLTPGLKEVWDYIKTNHPEKIKLEEDKGYSL